MLRQQDMLKRARCGENISIDHMKRHTRSHRVDAIVEVVRAGYIRGILDDFGALQIQLKR